MVLQTITNNPCQLVFAGGDEIAPHVDTNVTTSCGMQLVPHMPVVVPSSNEVPNNSSGLKGISNAQLGVGDGGCRQKPNRAASMSRRISVDSSNDNATMLDLEAGGNQIPATIMPPSGASKEELVRALFMVSYASVFVGMNAGLHRPAATTGSFFAGHQTFYYCLVAAILAAVPIEMAAAFWLQRSNGRRFHTFAEVLQRVGVVLLLIVSAVGGIELTVKV